MFGVMYEYYDQYENTSRIFKVAFTTQDRAEDWIEKRIDAPYLRIFEYKVDPEPVKR